MTGVQTCALPISDGIYRLVRDVAKSWGQDADKYASPPTPGAAEFPISVEDAIALIMDGVMPKGAPMEGAQEHFEKLQAFAQSDEFDYLDENPAAIPVFKAYIEQVRQLWAKAQSQAALLQAAQQFQQAGGQGGALPGPQGAPQPNAQQMPPVQANELMNESLPGAGGGGNPGPGG